MARILVAMSGGVDSTAAAALLLEQGHDCAGAHLSLSGTARDAEDARAAAQRLGMGFHVFDMRERFEREVIARFAASYLRGETPNPCIECNRYIKFAALLEQAGRLGYDAIATGHYARSECAQGRWGLKKALDLTKDQSYVLYTLTQGQLARVVFPLGRMTKAQVRDYARGVGFLNAERQESQDICFVPEGDYGAFLERYTGRPLRPGDFVDPAGRVLGRHRGTPCYTLGQRKGLGLALPRPGYVCGIDPVGGTVTVGEEALLFGRTLHAREVNLIACDTIDAPLRCKAKIRYRQAEQWAIAEQIDGGILRVTFDEPQRAITPGQAVVLYDGECVIGGGTIF
ncbi:MAG: tRNA 2-thiouridine(34) synthase MnmA [Firmicutes bacterium]|nr:tRNA 2-thiouridine(34) synthase MnmA [Bacillota bacterium]